MKSLSIRHLSSQNLSAAPSDTRIEIVANRAAAQDEGDEPFVAKTARLTAQLKEQFAESARLERIIEENLRRLGYE